MSRLQKVDLVSFLFSFSFLFYFIFGLFFFSSIFRTLGLRLEVIGHTVTSVTTLITGLERKK